MGAIWVPNSLFDEANAMLHWLRRRSYRQTLRLGAVRLIRAGMSPFSWADLYHWLFTLSWPTLLAGISVTYVGLNLLFAQLYLLEGQPNLENARPGSFWDVFFFSVQTMATIGYGAMYPRTSYANALVVVEVFIGLVGVAMTTGLMFARFSQPTARVIFSRVAVICPYEGRPTLMFRTANQRHNLIVEARVKVSILLPEVQQEAVQIRRLRNLKLVRADTPIFALSWLVMHPIDEESPFYGAGLGDLLASPEMQIVVSLTGLDASVSQTIHARHIYSAADILPERRFVDVVQTDPTTGDRRIDYTHFHQVVPLGASPKQADVADALARTPTA